MENILEKIYKSGLKLLEPLNSEETYATIVKEAVKLVGASYGSLLLEQSGEFKEVYSTLPIRVKRRKKGFTYRAFKEKKTFVIHTKEAEFLKVHPEFSKLPIKSIINIPLSYRGKSIGVLAVNSIKTEEFTKRELDILKLFGSLASMAIRKTQLYDETKKALETRDLFISMAAHELRTPLTSISGYIQLLYSKLSGANTSESRWIQHLYWESTRLTALVNELLEINRIKSGQLQYFLKECSLRDILERVKNNFRFSHPERNISIEDKLGDHNDIVVGDHDKIIQALTNVVDNAVKFSEIDSDISLVLKYKAPEILIQIRDNGIGIPKKDLPLIFQGFQQGSGHSKEGMGVGLFLVNDIVRRLHGSIKVHSRLNKGTTVEIKLPEASI